MIEGTVFSIQHFSIHDGPGIRTNVFLKGCNIRCAWCHNPENFTSRPTLSFREKDCVLCQTCQQVCPQKIHRITEGAKGRKHILEDPESCIACGRCVKECPTDCLSLVGEKMSVEQVMKEVREDRTFYKEGDGGLTVTGGEPTMQFEFLKELLMMAHAEGISTAIETNGTAGEDRYGQLLPYLNYILFDFKHYDTEKHRAWTGIGNEKILADLNFLAGKGKKIFLRCPIIPGVNDEDAHFRAIAQLSEQYKDIVSVELMPYHSMGLSKIPRMRLKQMQIFRVPDQEEIKSWKTKIREYGGEKIL